MNTSIWLDLWNQNYYCVTVLIITSRLFKACWNLIINLYDHFKCGNSICEDASNSSRLISRYISMPWMLDAVIFFQVTQHTHDLENYDSWNHWPLDALQVGVWWGQVEVCVVKILSPHRFGYVGLRPDLTHIVQHKRYQRINVYTKCISVCVW